MSRPGSVRLLLAALAFQGVSGVAGGLALVLDPSGALIGLPSEWLVGSPFGDYRIPGLVLSLLLGVAPLAVAYAVWARKPGSWIGTLLVGGALAIWIAVEIAVIGYHARPPLQLIYGALALVILGATMLPSVRTHLMGRR